MFTRVKRWFARRAEDYDRQEKGRLCAPCDVHCGEDLCKKVGCLNMDMKTNSTRLKLLVQRLEDAGYVFVTKKKETEIIEDNIVNLDDFRKR